MKSKYRRIEQLLYYREWAIQLGMETRNIKYVRMVINTHRKLQSLGVVATDIGHSNYSLFLIQMQNIIPAAQRWIDNNIR